MLVGEGSRALAQAAEEGIEALHSDVGSQFGCVADRGFRDPMQISPQCGSLDSVEAVSPPGYRHQTLRRLRGQRAVLALATTIHPH